jgi:carbonic anhydrase
MSHQAVATITSDQALKELMEGNERYVTSKLMHPHQTAARRSEVAGGQHPFATILGCADSRLSPEIIFDQGLGDLFVVRVAGNIVDDAILGSIEYAAEHLHTPLIVALGHSNCGAVGATVAGGELEGHLPSLARAIMPAVERAKDQAGDLLDNAVRANAKMVAEQLRLSEPVLARLVRNGQLKVVAGYYDLGSGKVTILS